MSRIRSLALATLLLTPAVALAEELVLPIFALNAPGRDGSRWSTEIYLVNAESQPVQVAVTNVLPGQVHRSTPCGSPFNAQARVVPARSAVLWTASGLASDLGCADWVLGALELHADGPVRVTGHLVRNPEFDDATPSGVLSGSGQQVAARPVADLPGPATLLVPALLWHRNPCGPAAFTSEVAFANPGQDAVTAILDIPGETGRAVRIDGREVSLPHRIIVEAGQWTRISLSPIDRSEEICLDPESFDLEVVIDGPLAVAGSVVDGWSLDGRMVDAVELR